MNDEDFIAKMSTLHHRFWLQSDAERLIAFANDSLLLRAGMKDQRAAEKYAADNPLGGPANMFDAIASRIRAGEEYYAVLADYNLTVNASLTEREEGYKAGLEAAAKIAIKHPSSSGFDIAKNIRIAELEVKK